jgi:predicted nucleic acid-binding protein
MADLYYFDSSALVKHYVLESGTDFVNRIVTNAQAVHFIVSWTRVEISAAKARRFTSSDALILLTQFDSDVSQRLVNVTVNDELLDSAEGLVRTYRLRAGDAVQLAGALLVKQRLPNPCLCLRRRRTQSRRNHCRAHN